MKENVKWNKNAFISIGEARATTLQRTGFSTWPVQYNQQLKVQFKQ